MLRMLLLLDDLHAVECCWMLLDVVHVIECCWMLLDVVECRLSRQQTSMPVQQQSLHQHCFEVTAPPQPQLQCATKWGW